MFAITDTSYRAITPEMPLNPGESRVAEVPAIVLTRIKSDEV